MNTLDHVEAAFLRDDIPPFGPGDTVKVNVRVVEGGRERIQAFEGNVIALRRWRPARDVHGAQDFVRCRRRAHLPHSRSDHRLYRGGAEG